VGGEEIAPEEISCEKKKCGYVQQSNSPFEAERRWGSEKEKSPIEGGPSFCEAGGLRRVQRNGIVLGEKENRRVVRDVD